MLEVLKVERLLDVLAELDEDVTVEVVSVGCKLEEPFKDELAELVKEVTLEDIVLVD